MTDTPQRIRGYLEGVGAWNDAMRFDKTEEKDGVKYHHFKKNSFCPVHQCEHGNRWKVHEHADGTLTGPFCHKDSAHNQGNFTKAERRVLKRTAVQKDLFVMRKGGCPRICLGEKGGFWVESQQELFVIVEKHKYYYATPPDASDYYSSVDCVLPFRVTSCPVSPISNGCLLLCTKCEKVDPPPPDAKITEESID
jgi:hypothetical protein